MPFTLPCYLLLYQLNRMFIGKARMTEKEKMRAASQQKQAQE